MKEELKAAEATAADFANIPQQAAQDLRATSSRRINPYYYYGYRRHCPCEPQCCDTRVLTVNTDYRNPGTYNADNVIGECLIDPYRWPTTWKNPCYRSALLKVRYFKIGEMGKF